MSNCDLQHVLYHTTHDVSHAHQNMVPLFSGDELLPRWSLRRCSGSWSSSGRSSRSRAGHRHTWSSRRSTGSPARGRSGGGRCGSRSLRRRLRLLALLCTTCHEDCSQHNQDCPHTCCFHGSSCPPRFIFCLHLCYSIYERVPSVYEDKGRTWRLTPSPPGNRDRPIHNAPHSSFRPRSPSTGNGRTPHRGISLPRSA